jgi:hypothetical protein
MRRGPVRGTAAWKEVMEAYYQDRLDAAFKVASTLGADFGGVGALLFRQIEGEYLTRKAATQLKPTEWLTLEFVADEVPHAADLQVPILNACDDIAERLDWKHSAPIMISVLTQEADAPWSVGRFGYFVDKYPYDKICIPFRSTQDLKDLREVVLHEYAHAIVLNLAEGHAPRWLDEMIAMHAQGGPDPRFAKGFASGQMRWLDPDALNVQYIAEREGKSGQQVLYAYQQSACIGAYLNKTRGEESFSKLLRSFSDNSFVQELAMRAANIKPADEAIKETYGINERQLFQQALEWLKRS